MDLLIDDITGAAYEAIEQAAAEGARAAALAALEREGAALREASHQQAEALRWRMEAETRQRQITETKKAGMKNTIIAGAVCLFGGFALGFAINK